MLPGSVAKPSIRAVQARDPASPDASTVAASNARVGERKTEAMAGTQMAEEGRLNGYCWLGSQWLGFDSCTEVTATTGRPRIWAVGGPS